MSQLAERLAGGPTVILDGATGTELQRRGVPMDHVAWSALAVETHPEMLRQIHEDYLRAGAEVLTTNSFATSRHVLEPAGLGERAAALTRRSVEIAKEARDRFAETKDGTGRQVWIAGSMSTFIAASDVALTPRQEDARVSYREQAEALASAGVDLLVLEMLRDVEQSLWIIEAARDTGLPVWLGFTCKRDEHDPDAIVLRGRDLERSLVEVLDPVLEAFGAPRPGELAAIMHSDVDVTAPALDILAARWSGPLGAYPNSGGWIPPNWQFVDIVSPEAFADAAQDWVAQGARVVGGCCGIGPEHIGALATRIRATDVPR